MVQIIPHWLSKQADICPNKIAIESTDDSSMTFGQLCEKSKQVARKLSTLGIKRSDHVALLSTNSVDLIVTIHALSYVGAVIVMLNTRLTSVELMDQINRSDVHYVITSDEIKHEKKLSFIPLATFSEINNLPEKEVMLITEFQLDSPFTMMFTSGTTGVAKAVVHSYGNYWWSAIGSLLNLGHEEKDKWLLPLPIFHVGGLSVLIRGVIYGMTTVLMEKYSSEGAFNLIKERKVTIVSFVTLMLQHYIHQLGKDSSPSTLRCILLGGGAVPEHLLKKVKKKRLPLIQSYGMTETCSQIVTLSHEFALLKQGSSGKALFPAQIKIKQVANDKVGEIYVKGPMVFKEYYKNKSANENSFIDGWFKTGDLGYLDGDGFLYVVERRSDLIISGGENIYPSEIEHVMEEIEGIIEVAVVGMDDETWGKVPVAYVVRRDEKVNKSLIQQYLIGKIASYKMPSKIIFINKLPRNASNKIMRHQLVKDLI